MNDTFVRHVILVKVGVNFGISNLSILDISSFVAADKRIKEVDKTEGRTLMMSDPNSNIVSH
ncbi:MULTISPECIES: hypothetical protein [unclassified Companilactobacillus]|jgi:hypothetical protein|uniref:hypothetical protein n=1 Tax=unclassified Companilactobacillus TaxID=2767904 RepID=UPI002FF0FFF5